MGCTRSKSTEILWCEPITSFGWLGSCLLANGHTHGTVYVSTYVRTQYDEKEHKKMTGTILPPNGEISTTVLADKEIGFKFLRWLSAK
jgi:hypothetical protein